MSSPINSSEKLLEKLYSGILGYLKLEDIDMDAYAFAQSGFLLNVNLFNNQQPIVNKEVFEVGNSIPENSLSYIPNGDFITSYSLFLNHLMPSGLLPEVEKRYQELALKKIAWEKAFVECNKTALSRSTDLKSNGSNSRRNDTNGENLLQKIIESEIEINKLLQTHDSKLKRSTSSNIAKASQLPILSQAMAEVSFITGARKIEGLNSYNMEVNSNPPKKIGSYAPRFETNIPADLYQKWVYNAENNIFPYEICVSSQESICIIQNNSESSQQFRKVTKGKQLTMEPYQIKAKFSGLEKVDLGPVNWFHPEFFIQKGYQLIPDSPKYFGSDGFLENIPSSIIIAYNVQIKIEFTEEGFNAFDLALTQTKNKGAHALSLGSLSIIPSGKQKNFNITKNHETNSVKLDTKLLKSANLIGVYSRNASNYIAKPEAGWNCMEKKQQFY